MASVVGPVAARSVVARSVVWSGRVRVKASVSTVFMIPALVHVAVSSTVPAASHAVVVRSEVTSVVVRVSSVSVPGVSPAV